MKYGSILGFMCKRRILTSININSLKNINIYHILKIKTFIDSRPLYNCDFSNQ